MSPSPRRWLPLPILLAGAALAAWLAANGREPAAEPAPPPAPRVAVIEAVPRDVQVRVRAHGSVEPRTEIALVAEIAGRVAAVGPSLAPGAFFETGDVLVELDPRDAELALERAEAAVARAESDRALARARAKRLRALAEQGVSSAAQLEEVEHAARSATARLREARAAREQARRDLERTRVHAPFEGRVRARHVDVGQFVVRGAQLARLYATDYAEVRLPIPSAELAFLDLPLAAAGAPEEGAPARLRAEFAGHRVEWPARIVRVEGEIAQRTRTLHAVARVEDPYSRAAPGARPPLTVGLFVEAEIEGRRFEDVFALPRATLRGDSELMVVDAESRVRARRVRVLRRERDRVLVGAGLEAGDRVCADAASVVDGLAVRVEPSAPSPTSSLAGLPR